MVTIMTMSASPECADAELVSQSRADSQDSFGQIVARYQTLICSGFRDTGGRADVPYLLTFKTKAN